MFDSRGHIEPQAGEIFDSREPDATKILLTFTEQNRENYEALEVEVDNCLTAHLWAHKAQEWQLVLDFAYALGKFLSMHGYWHENVGLLRRAVEAAKYLQVKDDLAAMYSSLGNQLHALGDWAQAIEQYDKSIGICAESFDFQRQAIGIEGVGNIYTDEKELEETLKKALKSLPILAGSRSLQGLASDYGNIGNVYADKGEFEKAVECYEKSRQLSLLTGDLETLANAYINLGLLHSQLGHWEVALGFYNQALATNRKLGVEQSSVYANLGTLLLRRGKSEEAIQQCQKALALEEKAGNKHAVAQIRANLASICLAQNAYDQAIQQYRQVVAVMEQVGDRHGQSNIHVALGVAYFGKQEWAKAIRCCEQSLGLRRTLGDVPGIIQVLEQLGKTYRRIGDVSKAIAHYEEALRISQSSNYAVGEADILYDLGSAYAQNNDLPTAISYYDRSLAIAESLGDFATMAQTSEGLGDIYMRQGLPDEALVYYKRSLELTDLPKDKAVICRKTVDIHMEKGCLEETKPYLHRLAAVCEEEEIDDLQGLAQAYNQLCSVYGQLGARHDALTYGQKALLLYEQLQDKGGQARACGNLGTLYVQEEDWHQATGYYMRALAWFEKLGEVREVAQVCHNLGYAYLNIDQWDLAAHYVEQALSKFQDLGDRDGIAQTRRNLLMINALWDRASQTQERQMKEIERLFGRSQADGLLALLALPDPSSLDQLDAEVEDALKALDAYLDNWIPGDLLTSLLIQLERGITPPFFSEPFVRDIFQQYQAVRQFEQTLGPSEAPLLGPTASEHYSRVLKKAISGLRAMNWLFFRSDTGKRYRAALVLGLLQDPGAVDSLCKTVQESDAEVVRIEAAWSLARIGDLKAVSVLAAVAEHSEDPIHEEAVKALAFLLRNK